MNNTLGVLQNCTGIRLAGCGGAAIDTTYCIPISGVAGSHFASTVLPRGRGNGCPNLLSFDRLSRERCRRHRQGQLRHSSRRPGSGGTPTDIAFASVTEPQSVDVTSTNGSGRYLGRSMRTNAGYFGVGCDDVTASYARTDNIFDWFRAATSAGFRLKVDVLSPAPEAPAFRHTLGNAYPNPMYPSTRIQMTNGVANGRVASRFSTSPVAACAAW